MYTIDDVWYDRRMTTIRLPRSAHDTPDVVRVLSVEDGTYDLDIMTQVWASFDRPVAGVTLDRGALVALRDAIDELLDA